MTSVLKSRSEILSARKAMRRSGISCLTPWIRQHVKIPGISRRTTVGDIRKSWDVLKTANFLRDHLSLTAPILDIGAYASEILLVLNRMGFSTLCGIDLNPRIQEMPVSDRIRYVVGDFMKTPFPDRSFAAITSVSVIEHGFDTPALLGEVSRLLSAGGYFIASFDYWPEKVDTTGIDVFGMDWKIFSREEVLALIEDARAYGLTPCGELDLDAEEPVIHWGGKDYTFAWLALRAHKAGNPT